MSTDVIRARSRKHLADLLEHVRDPLYRNAYALVINTAVSSALGMLYWVVVARLYPPDDVGRGSALISAIVFLSGVAQLNLRPVLARFIPVAGLSTGKLVAGSYVAASLVALVAGAGFLVVIHVVGDDDLFRAVVEFPTLAATFVLVVALWCVFNLQDGVLIGLRRAIWVLIANSFFGAAKIVVAAVLAGAATASFVSIVGSWILPMIVAVIAVNALVFRRWIPAHVIAHPETSDLISRRRIAGFVAGDYMGSLFAIAYASLLPVIVIARTDAATGAQFYIVWIIASSLQLIPIQMVVSLVVDTASNPEAFHRRARHLAIQMLRILGPAGLGIIVVAPLILAFFGTSYADAGTPLLRLLVLALAPFTLNVLYFGYLRVRAQTRGIMIGQAALAISIIGLSAVLLEPLGLVGVGIANLIGQTAVAAILALPALRPLFSARPTAHGQS